MYYMGFTWESFGIGPMLTSYRNWFIERINKEIAKTQETSPNGEPMGGSDIPTKAAHHNDAQVRALTGKARQFNRNPRTQRPATNF